MKRLSIFSYGVICYALSLCVFAYAFCFLGNLWIPKSIDSVRAAPLATALLVDVALLVIFAVQHSTMARRAFKAWWTGIVPRAAERSTYMLFSCLALVPVFALWQPVGGMISDRVGRRPLLIFFGVGGVLYTYVLLTFLPQTTSPLMAFTLAVIDGLKDAKSGNPPYLWAVFTHRGHRLETIKHGWKSIGRVFLFALVLDFVYEIVGQPAVYPDEAIVVAIILAIVPYAFLRGLVTRWASRK